MSSSRCITVSARPQLRKLFVSANALLCIPRCPAPCTCVCLLLAFSFSHVDYVLQATNLISTHDIQLLETAVCQILQRALGLHPKTRSDLACGASVGNQLWHYFCLKRRSERVWGAAERDCSWLHQHHSPPHNQLQLHPLPPSGVSHSCKKRWCESRNQLLLKLQATHQKVWISLIFCSGTFL